MTPSTSRPADDARQHARVWAAPDRLAAVFVGFLELSFFVEKQFLERSAPLRISRLFEHCPEMLNVLPNDETLHDPSLCSCPRGLLS
jgi:hypothetical protein